MRATRLLLGLASLAIVLALVNQLLRTPPGKGTGAVAEVPRAESWRPPALERAAGTVLDRRVVEIDRYAREHPADYVEIIARWEALQVDATGTGHEAYATMAIASTREVWERAAQAEIDRVTLEVRNAVTEWRWDDATTSLASFADALRGTSIDAPLAELEALVARERARWAGGRVYAHADFRKPGDDFPRSEGLRIDAHEVAHQVGAGTVPHLAFLTNCESRARFTFVVEDLPREARLRLRHIASVLDGDRVYSPVTVVFNGSILAGNWSPGNRSWVSSAVWDVSTFVRHGPNELLIQLEDGFSQYWLEEIEVAGLP